MTRRRDTGSATVWVAALLLLVLTATALAVGGATAAAARHSAQLAADLAALAGAGRIGVAPLDACAAATSAAAHNGAKLTSCEVGLDGPRTGEVRVEVRRPGRWAGFAIEATARARAARVPAGSGVAALAAGWAGVWQHDRRGTAGVPPSSPTTRTSPPHPAVPTDVTGGPTWT